MLQLQPAASPPPSSGPNSNMKFAPSSTNARHAKRQNIQPIKPTGYFKQSPFHHHYNPGKPLFGWSLTAFQSLHISRAYHPSSLPPPLRQYFCKLSTSYTAFQGALFLIETLSFLTGFGAKSSNS